ncbi:MAG: hypothetical protein CK425_00065 [Parachlamydia sp.]|nr:MAG: hypothetical protein CK425_00065 [Parachlamydia sp.]
MIFLIEDGIATNVHELNKEEWQKSVTFFREGDLQATARLIDLFNDVLKNYLQPLFNQMLNNFGAQLTNLAWKGSDNLIEKEIASLQNQKKSPFPYKMASLLIQMRQRRKEVLSTILKKGFEDDGRIHPERVFCTLSAGEQRRLVNLLTIEQACSNKKTRLVIFDEPLAHLDERNVLCQLKLLAELQLQRELPILIISHHHIEEICNILENVKYQINNEPTRSMRLNGKPPSYPDHHATCDLRILTIYLHFCIEDNL